MGAKKPQYVPPTIQRYAPFFAGSPSKPTGLMLGAKKNSRTRSAVSLTVPVWDKEPDTSDRKKKDR